MWPGHAVDHPLLVPRSWKSRAIPLPPSGPHRAGNGITLPLIRMCWYLNGWSTQVSVRNSPTEQKRHDATRPVNH